MEVIQCKNSLPGYQSPALTVQWLPWEQTDILREMLKSPPAVRLPVGRQDRLQCVHKMENMPHSFQIMLGPRSFPPRTPFSPPQFSLILCWLLPESVTTKRCWARKHTQTHTHTDVKKTKNKKVFDFTGRPINSVDSRGCNFQSISLEKQHVKGEITRKEQQHFWAVSRRGLFFFFSHVFI